MSERVVATSAPPESSYIPIESMYRLTRGIERDWGIEGYNVPLKSAYYKPLKKSFPKSLRKDFHEDAKRRINDPGPGTYSPDHGKMIDLKKIDPEWAVAQGAFKKSPRTSEIDTIIHNAKKYRFPGPGEYRASPKFTTAQLKKGQHNVNRDVPLGKIE